MVTLKRINRMNKKDLSAKLTSYGVFHSIEQDEEELRQLLTDAFLIKLEKKEKHKKLKEKEKNSEL